MSVTANLFNPKSLCLSFLFIAFRRPSRIQHILSCILGVQLEFSVSMPARSVLLNVSIIAKPIGKENVIEEVKEVKSEENVPETTNVRVGNRARVDSAAAGMAPTIYTPFPATTPNSVSPTSTSSLTSIPEVRACGTCRQHTKPDGSRLSHCKACASVYYCSKDCQRIDWPSHKRQCVYRGNPNRESSVPYSVPASPTST
ncbi:uncharacterized protein EI97DRAFT_227681 [Westerdykella ornata]|uniref:MYND-type domain-containing protein n=1 Tax=Westerdykella ornata TaxID=318751 RepID=A0A6A6JTD6_WESOR|nr:uncharacterized protein EI97DRAFT_227681 [Westerdykella ornata]KAF2279108.1 hypothetical protein EI97DRAFT_227681 [Westerdykella ornata]